MRELEARLQSSPRTTPAPSGASRFRCHAVLRDGTKVCMRAIRPDDKERLRIAFEHLSTESVYQRFFHAITELTPGELRHLTELDFRDHVGLVLTIEQAAKERLIAVCRFVRVAPGADRAEVGFAVADEYRRRGAATLLLQQLVALARGCGVRELVAQMLEDNIHMLQVFQNSGLPLRQGIERGIRQVVLTLTPEAPEKSPTDSHPLRIDFSDANQRMSRTG